MVESLSMTNDGAKVEFQKSVVFQPQPWCGQHISGLFLILSLILIFLKYF